MPITVIVRTASPGATRAGEAPSLTFDGSRVVIGRGAGSDVRLPDPSVSVRHASIRASGTEYAIVDEASTNGTWVGGVKLSPHTPRIVKSGDLLRIGRVWLEVAIGQKAATPELGLATRDLALALVKSAMDAIGDDTGAKIRIAEGPDLGEELRLVEEGRVYIVGRADRCDLPLADEDASREHAAIVRRGGQVLLRDMSSRNGVFLGGTRLTPDRDVVWRPPVMARIGRTVLALDEPVSVALAELEAADDEPMQDADAPPAPASIAAPGASARGGSSVAPASAPPRSEAPPESRVESGPVAPIAELAPTPPLPTVVRRRRGWTVADVLVVTIALGVIGASIAGLVWVLR